jgi:hypothetical protein
MIEHQIGQSNLHRGGEPRRVHPLALDPDTTPAAEHQEVDVVVGAELEVSQVLVEAYRARATL